MNVDFHADLIRLNSAKSTTGGIGRRRSGSSVYIQMTEPAFRLPIACLKIEDVPTISRIRPCVEVLPRHSFDSRSADLWFGLLQITLGNFLHAGLSERATMTTMDQADIKI